MMLLQVTDSVEGILLADGMTEAVDWIRLKETELVKPREVACQTSDTKIKTDEKKGDYLIILIIEVCF